MPSLMLEQRLHHHICLGLSAILLSSTLVGCGSGESKANKESQPKEVIVPKPKDFNIKVPIEMRNVVLKVFDNSDGKLVLERNVITTTNLTVTLPYVLDKNRLYRVEISTTPNSLIYNFLNSQYERLDLTWRALVKVDVSHSTQTVFINPSSEAIYQRALVRSGQLPTDENQYFMSITANQLERATEDVDSALLSAFKNLDIVNVEGSTLLNIFSPQDAHLKTALYANTYLSFGYFYQWAKTYPDNSLVEFAKNLAIDLRDGHLDGKTLRGDPAPLTSLVATTPDNIDPAKNTIIGIGTTQKNAREQYAASLKQAVLELADTYNQSSSNPKNYSNLQQRTYAGVMPITDPSTPSGVRLNGAGDYRRAVGFADISATCNGSIYPCKQGLIGINVIDHSLPTIEYLIGHYQDSTQNCQLNVRADGWIELIKDNQKFRSKLDGDSTDNLLRVNKADHEYLLNSSSPEPKQGELQYQFVQLHLKENQVLSASAGLDRRKAPDQLQSTQLQCNFS
ncbi:hypothetical protein F2A31_07440 [Acinetobacter suaedae]|uniref:Uncharacterized protein n=1 Tax=Acinetobacter suaedae TaxID=2609668 RepID=A0A5P1USG8_9GAMM|nr:hypothetical protein [Acinetobacter sp. C16S1]QER39554.1 hypothetical protein F2A31_07440 [Acinetobacter sp. C16S1]